MTFIWLLIWACAGTPGLSIHPLNAWTVFLGVAVVIDFLGVLGRISRR